MGATFNKTYTSPADLVQLLQQRGMDVGQTEKAEMYLRQIGYYRLSAYWYPLLTTPKTAHVFKQGVHLEQALMMYRFDEQLRLFIFNYIEKIEVAVRAAITNIISRETGDIYWMTNPQWYSVAAYNRSKDILKKEYDKSTEDFIFHFKQTYSEPYPPAWILAEILPLGTLTAIFRDFKIERIKKKVAKEFGLSLPVFCSWMTIVTVTRNLCCHHSRVWNKVLTLKALTEKRMARPWVSSAVQQGRIFYTLCIIKYLVDVVAPDNDMATQLRWLLLRFPQIDLQAMGFPPNWEMEALWQ